MGSRAPSLEPRPPLPSPVLGRPVRSTLKYWAHPALSQTSVTCRWQHWAHKHGPHPTGFYTRAVVLNQVGGQGRCSTSSDAQGSPDRKNDPAPVSAVPTLGRPALVGASLRGGLCSGCSSAFLRPNFLLWQTGLIALILQGVLSVHR